MQTPNRLSCRVEVRDDVVHLIAVGELDYITSQTFKVAVWAALSGRPENVVLDLTAVSLLSSEGATALIDAAYQAIDIAVPLAMRTSPQVKHRLDLLGVASLLNVTKVEACPPVPARSAIPRPTVLPARDGQGLAT